MTSAIQRVQHKIGTAGSRWVRCAFIALALILLHANLASAQETELVRGIITGPDKKPIEGVTVTIIGLLNQQQRITTTNSKGLYNALFQDAEGEYIVSVRRIGFAPQSVHVLRTGMSPILATDIRMNEVATILDDRTVTASRSNGLDADGKSIGGTDRDLLAGALFTLDPTDLLALAANVPGVMMIPGSNGADSGYSVLGLGADANNLMVDGSVVSGNNLPSQSIAKATLTTNTYDITRGGFAGASMSVTTRAGTDIFTGNFTSNLTNRHLTWSDPTNPYTSPGIISGSMGMGGPIIKRKLRYFGAMDLNDQRTEVFTLLNANSSLLGQYGIERDTIAVLKGILGNLQIPMTLTNVPDNRVSDRGTASLRLDWIPKANSSANMTIRGSWSKSGGASGGTTSFPTTGGESKSSNWGGSLNLSGYVGGLLNVVTSSFSSNSNNNVPYLLAPSGSVRIGTVFDAGRTGLGSLRFGGGGTVYNVSGSSGSITDQVSVITTNSKHNMKIAAGLSYNDSKSNFTTGLGSYTYQTLADLEAGKPASYSRTIQTHETQYSGYSWYIGPQDEWQASQKLQFSIGFRTDMARPGSAPPHNSVVDSLFGVRNDVVPLSVGISPRIGFSWTPTKGNPPKAAPVGTIPAGMTADQAATLSKAMAEAGATHVVSAGGAVISMSSSGGALPMAGLSSGGGARLLTISGGLGLYRNAISAQSIASLVDRTGLPNTTRYLSCVGDAVPDPVWTGSGDFSPETCKDGSGPITLNNSRPSVSLYDPNFQPVSRWSPQLGIDGLKVMGWNVNATGSYNLNTHQQSTIDLNLNRVPEFHIAGEADRPVYVGMENINTSTGLIVQNAARIHSEFGSVGQMVSDLTGKFLQFQLFLTPPKPLFGKLPFTFNYTWVPYARSEQRGLGGGGGGTFIETGGGGLFIGGTSSTTDGDPFKKEWANGTQNTHQITAGTSLKVWWFTLSARLSIFSPLPYTPTVTGDINGDGSSYNDRAFIYDPSKVSDTVLAGQMKSLLTGTSANARKCLEQQMGTIAGRNSCKTPWYTQTNLTLGFNLPSNFGFGDRLKFSAGLINAGSAIVRLTGLKNSVLGTTQNPYPNSQLLTVTGFDATNQRFTYKVNQLFGLPQNYGINNSTLSPFQVRLGASLALGGPPRSPMGTSLGLVPPKKQPPMTVEQVLAQLRKLSIDPVAPIIKLADSLRLTPEQNNAIVKLGDTFWTQADSIFAPLAEFVVSKGSKMTDIDLNTKLPKARADVQKLMATTKIKAMAQLTGAQKVLYSHFTSPAAQNGVSTPPAAGTPAAGGTPGAVPPVAKPPVGGGGGGDVTAKGGGGVQH